ncbi:MAG: adenylate/guanylate cyclase domain-containing protein [Myxococcales bacterium]|nr:adenylate/guanylate cyclase domain-containing protein [Myxococcales bacterium]
MKLPRTHWLAGFLAATLSTLLFSGQRLGMELPLFADFFEGLERRTLDLRFLLRGPQPAGPECVIVAFDEKTYAEAPELNRKRHGWSRVIAAAKEAGARAIAVDAFFDSPEVILPEKLRQDIEAFLDGSPAPPVAAEPALALLRRVREETRGDERLEETIRAAGNVVLALHLGVSEGSKADEAALVRGKFGQVVPGPVPPPRARHVIASLPRFSRAAAALGSITAFEDQTFSTRALPMARALGSGVFAPLSLMALAAAEGTPRSATAFLGPSRSLSFGRHRVALDEDFQLLLNFRGAEGSFATYSAVDLVEERLAPGALHDKIVFVGITQFSHDKTRTPFSQTYPGVELHATAVDNVLRGDPLRRSPGWLDALSCLAFCLLLPLLYWPRLGLRPWVQLGLSLALVFGHLAAGQVAFSSLQLWTPTAAPLFAFSITWIACLAQAYLGEGLRRLRLRRMFAHFLSPEVIADLVEHQEDLVPGGEHRELSVLFSDIRDFTRLSEQTPPDALVRFLNAYFAPMTGTVLECGGLLDKYIGDAIMAVFGAPRRRADHARQAVRCALHMHRRLMEPGEELRIGSEPLRIGIGLNTGVAVAGLMGSSDHLSYTAVGDTVNLASRLEGLTKTYGVFCLAGEATRQAAGDEYCFREVDRVRVKGKSEPAAIFELLSGPDHVIAEYQDLPLFERAIAAYRAGRFAEAREHFIAFRQKNPADPVSALYLTRLAELGDTAPPGWDGVFTQRTK